MFMKLEFPKWAYGDDNYSYMFDRVNLWTESGMDGDIEFKRAQVARILTAGDSDYGRIAGSYEQYLKVAQSKSSWGSVNGETIMKTSARRLIRFMCRWNNERITYLEFLKKTKSG